MKSPLKLALCAALMVVALPAFSMAKDKDNDRGDRDRNDRGGTARMECQGPSLAPGFHSLRSAMALTGSSAAIGASRTLLKALLLIVHTKPCEGSSYEHASSDSVVTC